MQILLQVLRFQLVIVSNLSKFCKPSKLTTRYFLLMRGVCYIYQSEKLQIIENMIGCTMRNNELNEISSDDEKND